MIGRYFSIVVLVFQVSFSFIAGKPLHSGDSITVYAFLHESCIISQHYTVALRTLDESYQCADIQFVGLFPNASSTTQKIETFQKKYGLEFDLRTDHAHKMKELFGAEVTPEVVVYNETQELILYKGRIDDTYFRVGKKRRLTSTSELKDVLEAITNNQPITTAHTEAVGCYINKKKNNNSILNIFR